MKRIYVVECWRPAPRHWTDDGTFFENKPEAESQAAWMKQGPCSVKARVASYIREEGLEDWKTRVREEVGYYEKKEKK